VVFFTGCGSAATTDSSYPSAPEAHVLVNHEEEFLYLLNAVGLSWGFAEMQRHISQPPTPEFQTILRYVIANPSNLINALVTVRKTEGGGSIWGTANIYMAFVPVGQWSEYDLNRIDQEGFLTDDELLSFFALAGKLLGEEDAASIIANHILGYINNFQFQYCNENSVWLFVDDRVGEIDYRFILAWNPIMERYTNYEITFTIGLCERYREIRRGLDLAG